SLLFPVSSLCSTILAPRKQILYVYGPDVPSKAKTTSCFAFNQNDGSQAKAKEGRGVSRVACDLRHGCTHQAPGLG
ncbi:hypothetical protein AMECASPLE_008635, partial [Ameca splendens]